MQNRNIAATAASVSPIAGNQPPSRRAPKRRRARALAILAAVAGVAFTAIPLRADDVTWNNGSGNFIWDTSSLNWTGTAWDNLGGDGAIFGATGAGAISVPGPINVHSINFTANGFTLTGAGPLTFVNGTSTLGKGVVAVQPGFTAQINVPINSALGFQKLGSGTLQLNGTGSSFGGGIVMDGGRGSVVADVLVGGQGTNDGGRIQLGSAAAMPASARVGIGTGYFDIGSNNVTVSELNFTNQNPSAAWNTTLNANNGVIGSGTLRVTGEINVLGATGGNFGNTIAANVDLGGGTQIIRIGNANSSPANRTLMFTGVVSNGSLLKTWGYNHNGVQTLTDGISLFNNNTYTGSTVLNAGTNVLTGTNATSSIKITGSAGLAGSSVGFLGANGSAQSATLLQAFDGGALLLDNNAAVGASGFDAPNIPAAQNNNRIRDDAAVELRYGQFIYRGLAGSTTASETFGSMNLLGGHNTVTIQPNNLGAATVTGAGNLTMAPRSTLQLGTVTSGTGNSGNAIGGNAQLKFNGTIPTADATGILPRVISATGAVGDFMTYNAATGFTPYTGYATDFNTAGTNVTNAASTTVASSVNINALRSTAGTNTTVTVGAGQTLGITSGMILNSGFGGLTITGGTLDFGANPGVLFGTGSTTFSGPVTGSAGLIHARGTGTYSGDFSGLTGPVDLYSGTLNLNTNTMSSPINFRGGALNINVSQPAGLGPIRFGVPETDANLMGLGQSTVISISGAGANAIIDRDLIVESGTTNVAGVPLRYSLQPGLSVLSNSTGSQTWSGDITLDTSLRVQGGGASATSTGKTMFPGDISGAGTFFVANGRVEFSGNYSNAGGFYLGDQGFSMKASFLGTGVGSGPLTISGGNSNTVSYNAGALQSGPIRVWNSVGSTAPQIIPLQNSTINNPIFLDNSLYSGGGDVIANVGAGINATWAGPISGGGTLTKTGTGVLVLSNNASTHTGPLAVNVGTLMVDGTMPSPSVTVASGATLAGSGALSGNVTVNSGGSLAPGGSVGTLDTGNLSLTGILAAEIDQNNGGPGIADLLDVSGSVTLNAATLDLEILNAASLEGEGTYLLVANDSSDAVNGSFAAITGLPPYYAASVDYAFSGMDSIGRIGDGNDIAVTLVPEPGSVALLALAGGLFLRRRRSA